MSLQIIKSVKGKEDYVPFNPSDYIENQVALARINADITQKELAMRMQVSQAYISKVERQDTVTAKVLTKVKEALLHKGSKK